MYHSINIGEKNTWTDWHLIPSSRPYIEMPTIKEKSVEIPGRNGVIDLTTFLTGSPTYGNRKGSWEFYVANEFFLSSLAFDDSQNPKRGSNEGEDDGGDEKDTGEIWAKNLRKIVKYCHGKVLTVALEDHPDHRYRGRLKVSYKPQKDYSMVTIEYDLEPDEIKDDIEIETDDPEG